MRPCQLVQYYTAAVCTGPQPCREPEPAEHAIMAAAPYEQLVHMVIGAGTRTCRKATAIYHMIRPPPNQGSQAPDPYADHSISKATTCMYVHMLRTQRVENTICISVALCIFFTLFKDRLSRVTQRIACASVFKMHLPSLNRSRSSCSCRPKAREHHTPSSTVVLLFV